MDRRWFETPVGDIPLRADSHELGQMLRWRSSRAALWSIHDRQVAIFDGQDAPLRKVVGTGPYHPAVDRIPWDSRWKPPSTAGGDGQGDRMPHGAGDKGEVVDHDASAISTVRVSSFIAFAP